MRLGRKRNALRKNDEREKPKAAAFGRGER